MNVQIQEYNGSAYDTVNPNANNADTLDGYHAKYFLNEISSLKTSVSNGKSAIAGAITDKRISTSSSDSFQTMANNISKIGVNSVSDFLNQETYCFGTKSSRTGSILTLSKKKPSSIIPLLWIECNIERNYRTGAFERTVLNISQINVPLSNLQQRDANPVNFTLNITTSLYVYNETSGIFTFNSSSTNSWVFNGTYILNSIFWFGLNITTGLDANNSHAMAYCFL